MPGANLSKGPDEPQAYGSGARASGATGADPLLSVRDLRVSYGNIEAVKGLTFSVDRGEIVCLIGANGAGKTTTLRTLSGLLRPTAGEIHYAGERIDELPAHHIVRKGLAQVPEGRRVFPYMTVRENLDMGAFTRHDTGRGADLDRIFELFPILRDRSRQAAGTLSGGEQQMLAMGRALMARPQLLLMDEPSMGLAPLVVQRIFDIVREISRDGTTILLVEQNAAAALRLADRGYVLETGRIVLADAAAALLTDEQVRKTYLGEE
jgi:branched-chain amino acid transport system ATP-binding protein